MTDQEKIYDPQTVLVTLKFSRLFQKLSENFVFSQSYAMMNVQRCKTIETLLTHRVSQIIFHSPQSRK